MTAAGAARSGAGAGLAWASLGLAGLIVGGYALTWIAAFTVRGGHPPLAAVLWVGLILASLAVAPFGALLGGVAAVLERRASGRAGRLAVATTGLHLLLFALALYFRLR